MTFPDEYLNSDRSEDTSHYKDMANAIRALSMDAVQKANSGHPGMPMGMADVATVLFSKYMNFNPDAPLWYNRDRFILSAGHGSMLLYSLLYLTGYQKVTLDDIKNFRQLHAITAGHPEIMQDAGIEMTTGPLGQGIASSVGVALAERMLNAKFGDDLINHKTYVIASDGDLMEGISHEACSLAGHLGLGNLIVFYDDNGISIDGSTDLSYSEDAMKRFEAYGWKTLCVDGHDYEAIERAIVTAKAQNERPVLISCKTRIGFGAPTKENTSSSHGSPLGEEEIAGARKNLDWDHAPFDIPSDILALWRRSTANGKDAYERWLLFYNDHDMKDELADLFTDKGLSPALKEALHTTIKNVVNQAINDKPTTATRRASGKVLEALVDVIPNLIGGSADLTGSNITKVNDRIVQKGNYDGQYIHYGVREHGMAAMMNGLALHGGIIPYSGTFLCFSDYCRPSIRLAALMKVGAIHVMTHDSIGLGEDGPTHQPVEHMAALRAIPNCYSYRPADLVETAEAWELAIANRDASSVLALTRQNLPAVRLEKTEENLSARGGYILREAEGDHEVTLFATGSEVEIALEAKDKLEENDIGTRIVSVPCYDLLMEQDADYIQSLRGDASVLGAVEAAIRMGWDSLIGYDGVFVGMNSYGDSAPYEDLYKHFGITSDALVDAIKAKL